MLHRLIYFSEKTEHFKGIDDVRDILNSSERNNPKNFITGALYFNERHFLQILEGGRDEISQAYNRIALDKRHKNVTLVSMSMIEKRDFDRFSMLYLGEINVEKSELLRFSPVTPFNPERLTEQNILELFRRLKKKESSFVE